MKRRAITMILGLFVHWSINPSLLAAELIPNINDLIKQLEPPVEKCPDLNSVTTEALGLVDSAFRELKQYNRECFRQKLRENETQFNRNLTCKSRHASRVQQKHEELIKNGLKLNTPDGERWERYHRWHMQYR